MRDHLARRAFTRALAAIAVLMAICGFAASAQAANPPVLVYAHERPPFFPEGFEFTFANLAAPPGDGEYVLKFRPWDSTGCAAAPDLDKGAFLKRQPYQGWRTTSLQYREYLPHEVPNLQDITVEVHDVNHPWVYGAQSRGGFDAWRFCVWVVPESGGTPLVRSFGIDPQTKQLKVLGIVLDTPLPADAQTFVSDVWNDPRFTEIRDACWTSTEVGLVMAGLATTPPTSPLEWLDVAEALIGIAGQPCEIAQGFRTVPAGASGVNDDVGLQLALRHGDNDWYGATLTPSTSGGCAAAGLAQTLVPDTRVLFDRNAVSVGPNEFTLIAVDLGKLRPGRWVACAWRDRNATSNKVYDELFESSEFSILGEVVRTCTPIGLRVQVGRSVRIPANSCLGADPIVLTRPAAGTVSHGSYQAPGARVGRVAFSLASPSGNRILTVVVTIDPLSAVLATPRVSCARPGSCSVRAVAPRLPGAARTYLVLQRRTSLGWRQVRRVALPIGVTTTTVTGPRGTYRCRTSVPQTTLTRTSSSSFVGYRLS